MSRTQTETGTRRSDESVMTALDELKRIEEERQEALARAAVREREERVEAECRAREAEAHRLRVSEHEARLRVEAERQVGDAAADRRLATLRVELARVQAEREETRLRLIAQAEAAKAPAPTQTRALVAGVFLTAVGAALATLIVAGFMPEAAPVPEPIVVAPATSVVEVEPEPVVAEVEASPAVAEPEVTAPPPTIVRPRPPRQTPLSPRGAREERGIVGLDVGSACGDDPLCALDGISR